MLMVVALSLTVFHISSAVFMSLISAPRRVEIVDRMMCSARYSHFSNIEGCLTFTIIPKMLDITSFGRWLTLTSFYVMQC